MKNVYYCILLAIGSSLLILPIGTAMGITHTAAELMSLGLYLILATFVITLQKK